jgi:hypothetical protein
MRVISRLLVISLCASLLAGEATAEPIAQIKADRAFKRFIGVVHVGSLTADSDHKIKFSIQNNLSFDVDLRTVETSCTCTKVQIPQVVLKPGKKVPAIVEMRTPKYAVNSPSAILLTIPLPKPSSDKVMVRLEYELANMLAFVQDSISTSTDVNTGIGKLRFAVATSPPAKHEDVEIKLVPELPQARIESETNNNILDFHVQIPKSVLSEAKEIVGAVVLVDRRSKTEKQTLPFVISKNEAVVVRPNPCLAFRRNGRYAVSCLMQIRDPEYLKSQIDSEPKIKPLDAKIDDVRIRSLKHGILRLSLEFDSLPTKPVSLLYSHGTFHFTKTIEVRFIERGDD